MAIGTSGVAGVAGLAGAAFSLIFRALKVVRPERPIHPKGTSLTGELIRDGLCNTDNPQYGEPSGVQWIDLPGKHAVTARYSRSLGLPAPLPDILGLALRLEDDGGPEDVLFATTGWSWPARFALLPRRDAGKATFTTLMPYKGAHGPVLLGLTTDSPGTVASGTASSGIQPSANDWVLAMHYAKPSGPWIRFGTLALRPARDGGDTGLRFDPVLNPLNCAGTYTWTRRLRAPAYGTARQPRDRQLSGREPNYRHPSDRGSRRRALHATSPPTHQSLSRSTHMVTVSKTFLASANDVWNVIADGWLYSGWVVGASRIRDVDALWPAEGAVLHHSVGAWPLLINDKTSVTAANPGKSIELIARGWPLGEAKVVITIEEQRTGCKVSMAEDAIKGPGSAIPKFIRDPLITVRNNETLKRLELMASGGAGTKGPDI
ncbi:SRPBCC family protein [Arthrobacter rhizosphaerae]|uniref:SRPBCC family protein n=1 Tax=Arthrobacter rhizosphaerae TaxID=2855490 RepID=UPI001FF6730A|nr:SRPBCC family protein [Arthrobacter rhizosphaerae]